MCGSITIASTVTVDRKRLFRPHHPHPVNTKLKHLRVSFIACQFIASIASVDVVFQCKHLEIVYSPPPPTVRFKCYIITVLYISVLLSNL